MCGPNVTRRSFKVEERNRLESEGGESAKEWSERFNMFSFKDRGKGFKTKNVGGL